jgi:hypothetical protein
VHLSRFAGSADAGSADTFAQPAHVDGPWTRRGARA